MKYVSLDIETTDTIPYHANILMLSMIVEDSEKSNIPLDQLPHFTCFVKQREPIEGSHYALAMNSWILDILSGRNKKIPYPIYDPVQYVHYALSFLEDHFGKDRVTVAGKNVAGFDLQFLPGKLKSKFRHRCIDPGSVFIDWSQKSPLSLGELNSNILNKNTVAHDAREDALDVIALLRTSYPENK